MARIQYALLGLVLSLGIEQVAIRSYNLAGGSNGISNVPTPTITGRLAASSPFSSGADYLLLVVIIVAVLLMMFNAMLESHFGRVYAMRTGGRRTGCRSSVQPAHGEISSPFHRRSDGCGRRLTVRSIRRNRVTQPLSSNSKHEGSCLGRTRRAEDNSRAFLMCGRLEALQFGLGSHFENVYLLIVDCYLSSSLFAYGQNRQRPSLALAIEQKYGQKARTSKLPLLKLQG